MDNQKQPVTNQFSTANTPPSNSKRFPVLLFIIIGAIVLMIGGTYFISQSNPTNKKEATPTTTTSNSIQNPNITSSPKPDLLVMRILKTYDQDDPKNRYNCKKGLGLLVSVKNQSASMAGTFVVQAGSSSRTVKGGLLAGYRTDMWFPIGKDSKSEQTVTVDSNNQVDEGDENNNTLTQVPADSYPKDACNGQNQQATSTQTPNSTPDPSKISTAISCSPGSITPYGDAGVRIDAVLKDQNNVPLAGKTVSWVSANSAIGVFPTSSQTHTQGETYSSALLTPNSTSNGTTTIKASFNGDARYNPSSCTMQANYTPFAPTSILKPTK